ncbi:MAG: VWA domain-containing protein [Bacteroidota bacterium]
MVTLLNGLLKYSRLFLRNSILISFFTYYHCLLLLIPIFIYTKSFSQSEIRLTRILFVFDGSQSMYGKWQSGRKIDIAQKLLSELLDSLTGNPNIELALRIYGHQSPVISRENRNCEDTKLEVPFSKNNADLIKNRLKSVIPKGTTPIAYSLEKAAGDFPACDNCRNIIILITDGIEECEGDPCAVSWALQKKGVILKPFVIGMGLSSDVKKSFECVGNYFDASNEGTFRTVLNVVISQALNSTTAQINLLDIYSKPTETNVNMTFYDQYSGAIRYNYIHTINHRGNPDTLIIDPLGTYRMVVHTIPPVEVDSITLTPGKHTIIAADVPQGALLLKVQGRSDYKSLQCIVRKAVEMPTLNIQSFNQTEKYLVGKYDIEVLSLPRILINDVEISQSHTTTVEIPQPGIASILLAARGHGSIYLEKDNELELIFNIDENITRKTLILQPGRYKIVYRTLQSEESIYTTEKSFKIESGKSTQVKMY